MSLKARFLNDIPFSLSSKGPSTIYGTWVKFSIKPKFLKRQLVPVRASLSRGPESLRSPYILPLDFEIISDKKGSKYETERSLSEAVRSRYESDGL